MKKYRVTVFNTTTDSCVVEAHSATEAHYKVNEAMNDGSFWGDDMNEGVINGEIWEVDANATEEVTE